LKTSGSSYRTSKLLLSAVLSSLFALFLFQCKGETYLGVNRDELERRLAAGDDTFLDKVDAAAAPGAEIFSFAPGAGYFFGLAARERGRNDLFTRFLKLEIEKGSAPFRHWAVRDLLEYYNDDGEYEKTVPLAESYLADNPASPFRGRVMFLVVESFYWRKADREVLARLEKYFPGDDASLKSRDPELFLFKVVASCRLALSGWEALVREFFYTMKASALHARLFSFLRQEKEKLSALLPFEQDLFEAVSLEGDGKHREAAAKFERLLPRLAPASLSGTALAADFTAAALGGTPAGRQAALLQGFALKASGADKAALDEAAGRIYLAVKDYGRARACLETALAANAASGAAADPLLEKRALYRLIRIGLSLGAEQGLAAFQAWGPRLSDPDYCADEADDLVNLLVSGGKYASLVSLASSPPAWFPQREKAELAYVAARLLRENFAQAGADKEAKIAALFKTARDSGGRGYYGFLAAHFLKEDASAEALFGKPAASSAARPERMSDAELVADGCFAFGLYRRALALAGDDDADIGAPALAWWAAYLSRRERPYEAIQVLARLREKEKGAFSRAQMEIFYPRAFAALITPAASEYGLDEHLYFSLVRQESAFNAGIASSAGAVGLTQLMPDTGEWIAGQLKAGAADLTEPATSVRFGAYYLSFLKIRLETPPYVLAGYNAGPNIARRWRQRWGGLPADLAVEAFDYAETRDFIKSIFSGRVIYDALYKNKGAGESARLFYNF
jgi:soluble lytic murein transglycosylase